ncbi:hypothetical protein ACFL1S_02285 [Pseudomonadota bacterium]
MSDVKPNFSTTCPDCGHELLPETKVCPGCGKTSASGESASDPWSKWSKAGNALKTKWVASVAAFWVSMVVMLIVYFVEKKLNLILASIVLGMMLIGVWLKIRYQMHQRAEPNRHTENA